MSPVGVGQAWAAEVHRLASGASVLAQARGRTAWLALDATHQGRTPTACFVLAQGTSVLQHGLRAALERPDRRSLSVFSLGLRWLDRARTHLVPLATSLHFHFP